MLKIEVQDQSDGVILSVEGRLVGIYVPELERCWRDQTMRPVARVVVDLKSVFGIDEDGRRLLRAMHESGVHFRGAGMRMQDELAAIARSVDL